jgi:glutamine synthetase
MGLYSSGVTKGSVIEKPTSSGESQMRACEASMMLRDALGADLVNSYVKLRHAEWNDYMRRLTDWERNHTLDV